MAALVRLGMAFTCTTSLGVHDVVCGLRRAGNGDILHWER